jgi:hypothetical protein
MAQFRVRWTSNDGDDWTSIEATDPEDAAEGYAASLCNEDSSTYDAFERGQDIEVRAAGSPDADTYRVTCESDPTFRALRVPEGA